MPQSENNVLPIDNTANADVARSNHLLINAFEVCPHLWELIEEAAASGTIDLTEWKHKVTSCAQCKRDLVSLIEKLSDGVTGTASFFVSQGIAMLKKTL